MQDNAPLQLKRNLDNKCWICINSGLVSFIWSRCSLLISGACEMRTPSNPLSCYGSTILSKLNFLYICLTLVDVFRRPVKKWNTLVTNPKSNQRRRKLVFSGTAKVSKNCGSRELLLPKASGCFATLYSIEKMIFSIFSFYTSVS